MVDEHDRRPLYSYRQNTDGESWVIGVVPDRLIGSPRAAILSLLLHRSNKSNFSASSHSNSVRAPTNCGPDWACGKACVLCGTTNTRPMMIPISFEIQVELLKNVF